MTQWTDGSYAAVGSVRPDAERNTPADPSRAERALVRFALGALVLLLAAGILGWTATGPTLFLQSLEGLMLLCL